MVNTSDLVSNTWNSETCFQAGIMVSDFSLSYQIECLVSVNPASKPTFGFLIDHAHSMLIVGIENAPALY